ncbi:hypothetical protein COV61_01615 [Candidatus Micrarchaeota archaeon CG11_big_fil_rev_8_21_14_0_20_47_5]|nr:MAG: hypothetical protein COV61_01615 [Candidatus Micrarchaeota archaeon CG11_big_fil_rev_8_21_14_0_20_47_5]
MLSLSFSQMSNISGAFASLCDFLANLLPILSMLMVVAGGAVYAGGQMMGAETRARANVWATAMLVGALIGILVSVIGPFVMQAMYGSGWTTACQEAVVAPPDPCTPDPCPPQGRPSLTKCCPSPPTYVCKPQSATCGYG